MTLKAISTALPDVLLLEPKVFGDARGFFFESFNRRSFREATGVDADFVQDNHSRSSRGVLRGLHYQIQQAQGKLIRVVAGEIFDVVVDLRRSSSSFGRSCTFRLKADAQLLWVPAGFAHGFLTLSGSADVLYKATDYYAPVHERTLAWNDPQLAIDWPLAEVGGAIALSPKDEKGVRLKDAETYA